jgi:AcrR family transcriptional regulator
MADGRPFHHGNLRAALLDQAEVVLHERGIDALSLRELARDTGVSHAAPRKHFIDRNALLDALAERGFTRLAADLRAAASQEPDDFRRVLHAASLAYLRFAEREPALLDLMLAAKVDSSSEAVRRAAELQFDTLTDIGRIGVDEGLYAASDVERLMIVLSATVQGIAAILISRRVTPSQSEVLIDDAIALFLAGAATESWKRFSEQHPWTIRVQGSAS